MLLHFVVEARILGISDPQTVKIMGREEEEEKRVSLSETEKKILLTRQMPVEYFFFRTLH